LPISPIALIIGWLRRRSRRP